MLSTKMFFRSSQQRCSVKNIVLRRGPLKKRSYLNIAYKDKIDFKEEHLEIQQKIDQTTSQTMISGVYW